MEVSIKPDLLIWARERAHLHIDGLSEKFPKIEKWEAGEMQPTLRQLEDLAKSLHVPIGYLFLDKPPAEPLPIKDFRTLGSGRLPHISINLRDTIYLCQRRQTWYRDYAVVNGLDKIAFVGCEDIGDAPDEAGREFRKILQISMEEQFKLAPDAFLSALIERVETVGVLVMRSGVVGSNNSRPLNIEEFRGFALTDEYAPLIFVNSKDNAAGNIFTLAHELAHLCLGQTGISNKNNSRGTEQWCNAFAAEFLVPLRDFQREFDQNKSESDNLGSLSKHFNVSRLVILQRMRDCAYLTQNAFDNLWRREMGLMNAIVAKKGMGGGHYYNSLRARVGKRFLRALYRDTVAGNTLYRDAFRLAGVKTAESLKEAVQSIGEG